MGGGKLGRALSTDILVAKAIALPQRLPAWAVQAARTATTPVRVRDKWLSVPKQVASR